MNGYEAIVQIVGMIFMLFAFIGPLAIFAVIVYFQERKDDDRD